MTASSRLRRLASPLVDRVYGRDLSTFPPLRRAAVASARTLLAAVQAFRRDGCALRASALTYMALMAIVPLLALAAALARGLGAAEPLWAFVRARLEGSPEAVRRGFDRIVEYVDRTNFTTLGALGLLLLVWTALSVFSRVERAFQEIWKVRRARSGVRRYGNYLGGLLVAPLLVVAAGAAHAAITASPVVSTLRDRIPLLGGALRHLLVVVPLLVQIGVFAGLYRILPGVPVPWRCAGAGGAVAGLLEILLQSLYFGAQIGVAQYNTIYGSLASLPLILVYLYATWSVLLFGAEIAHAAEHAPRAAGPGGAATDDAPPSRRALLAVMAAAAESFRAERGAWVPPGRTGLPRDAAERAVEDLVAAGLLVRAEEPEGAVIPGRPLEAITAKDAVEARGARPGGGSLPPELVRELERAEAGALEALARYRFAPTPPPPSGSPATRP